MTDAVDEPEIREATLRTTYEGGAETVETGPRNALEELAVVRHESPAVVSVEVT